MSEDKKPSWDKVMKITLEDLAKNHTISKKAPVPVDIKINLENKPLSAEILANLRRTPYKIQLEKSEGKNQQTDCPHYMSNPAALYRKPGEELEETL